jgi:hypothetical protein
MSTDTIGNLYFADYGSYKIRKVTFATNTITTVAGSSTLGYSGDGGLATNAELSGPYDIDVDTNGFIFIFSTIIGIS